MKTIRRMRRIPASDKELLAALKRIVLERVPGAELILYGSAARGTREPDSDYDVLILTGNPLLREQEEELQNAIYDMELDREVVICTYIETHQKWDEPLTTATPLYRNIQREGVVL